MESDDGVVRVCLVCVFHEAEERVLCWLAVNGELALQEKSGWPCIGGFEILGSSGHLAGSMFGIKAPRKVHTRVS